MNARSFASFERKTKFTNANKLTKYSIPCVSETWLNENIKKSELPLDNYLINSADWTQESDRNRNGGVLMAVKPPSTLK